MLLNLSLHVPSVVHEPDHTRFVLTENDGFAELRYRLDGSVVTIIHTFVPGVWRGRGFAAQLVKSALTWAAAEDFRIVAECDYADGFIRRHPSYAHLLATRSDSIRETDLS